MDGGAGSCKGILCFQVSHFFLESPSVRMKPEAGKASGSRGIPGGVRIWVSTLILTHYGNPIWTYYMKPFIKLSMNEERERRAAQ